VKGFKFGGASVKDATGVRNVARVVRHFEADDLVIVVSAMGKTTNALEEVVWDHAAGRNAGPRIDALRGTHLAVLASVAAGDQAAADALQGCFDELAALAAASPSGHVDREYDAIVSLGEVWSTLIVSAHLAADGLPKTWADARQIVVSVDLFPSA
jgi:aspartate kinase